MTFERIKVKFGESDEAKLYRRCTVRVCDSITPRRWWKAKTRFVQPTSLSCLSFSSKTISRSSSRL